MTDTGPDAPPVRMLFKGNFALPGEEVGPGFPSVFEGSPCRRSSPARRRPPRAAARPWPSGSPAPTTR